jgi:acetolactate synthase-1/2/3 large subunit
MNGAESLVRTALAAGVDVCFANPGTTEMQLVQALDVVPGMRAVLGVFEGVCTGAADGYARMSDRPAATLLHLGPGLGNGIANLHNARRANAPVLNVIGDHASWHVANDPPLASDIESLARPVSVFVRTSRSPRELSRDTADAIAASLRAPGGVATLVVPADCAWGEAGDALAKGAVPAADPPDARAVGEVARALRSGDPALLLLGGRALREAGLRAAGRVAAHTGARLASETFVARLERGAGLPAVEKLPYFPEQVTDSLKRFAHLVLVGAKEPVSFFGYPNGVGRPRPESCALHALASPSADALAALEALADAVGAPRDAALPAPAKRPDRPSGALSPSSLGAAIAALQPEGAILVDEAATSGAAYGFVSGGCPRSSYLGLTGGAIGQGLPCATGAAIACPDRRVIAFQADGSGLYTPQALWTQAREGLDVTTIVCANREYRILRVELARADVKTPGPKAQALTSLAEPVVDWVALAQGFGVPARRVETAEALVAALAESLAEPGPRLIEAML